MEHGYAKIFKGPEHFVAILHTVGVPAPDLLGWAAILVELIGGLAVLAGAFVPWAQFGPPGYETDLLYLACLATLVLRGSGPFAVDGVLAKLRSRRERAITAPGSRA
jgi:putative oxidoreductase